MGPSKQFKPFHLHRQDPDRLEKEKAAIERAEIFGDILCAMLFPEQRREKKALKHRNKEIFIKSHAEAPVKRRLQDYIENHIIYGGASNIDDETIDIICERMLEGLQAGAVIHSLYWLDQYRDDLEKAKYATIKFAAHTAFKKAPNNSTLYKEVLQNLTDYVTVGPYWAAFLVIAYPKNFFGLEHLKKDSCLGPLEAFLAADLSLIASYASHFREFSVGYKDPRIGVRAATLMNHNGFVKLQFGSLDKCDINVVAIPEIWAPDHTFKAYIEDYEARESARRLQDRQKAERDRDSKLRIRESIRKT